MSSLSSSTSLQPHVPLFILDFDGTITCSDTILPLLNASVTHHASSTTVQQKLSHVLDTYATDWERFHASPPRGVKIKDFESVKELVTYQRSLKGTEEASFERVGESALLKGIARSGWYALAKTAVDDGDVKVRAGFREFVDEIENQKGRWGIVSVNFCEDWIRGVLATSIGKQKSEEVEIYTNLPGKNGVLTGYDGGEVICTSDSKLEVFKSMIRNLRSGREGGNFVYVGDSSTDIECLLYGEGEGVVMVKEDGGSKLVDTLKFIGEAELQEELKYLRMVRNARYYDHAWKKKNGRRVWFAKDFGDLLDSPLFRKTNA